MRIGCQAWSLEGRDLEGRDLEIPPTAELNHLALSIEPFDGEMK